MWILLSPPLSPPGTKGQETAEAVSHKALARADLFVTICEAFDSAFFTDVMHDLEAVRLGCPD